MTNFAKKGNVMPNVKPTNQEIADLLLNIASLLEVQDANPFRVRAYRQGAQSVLDNEQPLATMVREGKEDELTELTDIGEGLSSTIAEYVRTGRSSILGRLQGEVTPEKLFATVPGIGQNLAERIVNQLDIHSLEELEQAAHDGRLRSIQGFGEKRTKAVRVSLAGMLDRSAQRRRLQDSDEGQNGEPPVDILLEIDEAYQQKAETGELRKIAPRRFNPDNEAWLPIMHAEREQWSFTVLYSNTARAHDLNKTHDWVVIYYESDGQEDQCTVVTETRGPLKGERVVRGREKECLQYYLR
jgi:DNA polymerase (family 10)